MIDEMINFKPYFARHKDIYEVSGYFLVDLEMTNNGDRD